MFFGSRVTLLSSATAADVCAGRSARATRWVSQCHSLASTPCRHRHLGNRHPRARPLVAPQGCGNSRRRGSSSPLRAPQGRGLHLRVRQVSPTRGSNPPLVAPPRRHTRLLLRHRGNLLRTRQEWRARRLPRRRTPLALCPSPPRRTRQVRSEHPPGSPPPPQPARRRPGRKRPARRPRWRSGSSHRAHQPRRHPGSNRLPRLAPGPGTYPAAVKAPRSQYGSTAI